MGPDAPHPPRAAAAGMQRRVAGLHSPAVWIGALAAVIVAVAILVWLLVRDGDDGTTHKARPTRAPAHAASIKRLYAVASAVGHPIFWAGPQPHETYETTQTKNGSIYVRYLPPGVKPGDPRASFLTVGTYPQKNAFATLKATAKKQRVAIVSLPGGGLAFEDKNSPTSMYLAYPGFDYQVEVYDPKPGRARELVTSGQIAPLGAPPRTPAHPRATTPAQLRSLAARLGHPIYWAGTEPGITYELTRTKDGRVYIRYLPSGVEPGDAKPDYLTVGTYPLKGAFAIVKRTAAKSKRRPLDMPGRGVAYADEKDPTSVYLAFPGQDLEVEVYDPSTKRARELVTSGRIAPVP